MLMVCGMLVDQGVVREIVRIKMYNIIILRTFVIIVKKTLCFGCDAWRWLL